MSPRVSLCTIVKNGAETLPAAWQSVASLIDEWVLVDTGSTDGTHEAALALKPDLVWVDFAWSDDFAAARNASLDAATGDWLLVMDADEVLLPDGLPLLRTLFRAAPPPGTAFALLSQGRRGRRIYSTPILRLFGQDARLRYRGRVHEQPMLSDGTRLHIQALHRVCLLNAPAQPEKSAYYAELLRRSLSDAQSATPYLRYRYVVDALEIAGDADLEILSRHLALAIAETRDVGSGIPGFSAPIDLAVCSLFQIRFRQHRLGGLESLFARHSDEARHAEFYYSWGLARLALQPGPAADELFYRSLDPRLLPLEPGRRGALKPFRALYDSARLQGQKSLALLAAYRCSCSEEGWEDAIYGLEAATGIPKEGLLADLRQELETAFARRQDEKVGRLAATYLGLKLDRVVLDLAGRSYARRNLLALAEALAAFAQLLFAGQTGAKLSAAGVELQGSEWSLLQQFIPPSFSPRVQGVIRCRSGERYETIQRTLDSARGLAHRWLIARPYPDLSKLRSEAPLTAPRAPGHGDEADWLLVLPAGSALSSAACAGLSALLRYLPLVSQGFCSPDDVGCWLQPSHPRTWARLVEPEAWPEADDLPLLPLPWLALTRASGPDSKPGPSQGAD